MPTHVYANNNEVASKAADGKSIAAFPDVCFSPPAPPVGPIPLPYPNTSEVKDTDSGTAKVFVKDKMSGMAGDSHMTKSMGDESATQNFNKGMITSALQGKCYFGLWSMDVNMEGKGVPRHLDMVTHNHGSKPENVKGILNSNHEAIKKAMQFMVNTEEVRYKVYFVDKDGFQYKKINGLTIQERSESSEHCRVYSTTSGYFQIDTKATWVNIKFDFYHNLRSEHGSQRPGVSHDLHRVITPMQPTATIFRPYFTHSEYKIINVICVIDIGLPLVIFIGGAGDLWTECLFSTAKQFYSQHKTNKEILYFTYNGMFKDFSTTNEDVINNILLQIFFSFIKKGISSTPMGFLCRSITSIITTIKNHDTVRIDYTAILKKIESVYRGNTFRTITVVAHSWGGSAYIQKINPELIEQDIKIHNLITLDPVGNIFYYDAISAMKFIFENFSELMAGIETSSISSAGARKNDSSLNDTLTSNFIDSIKDYIETSQDELQNRFYEILIIIAFLTRNNNIPYDYLMSIFDFKAVLPEKNTSPSEEINKELGISQSKDEIHSEIQLLPESKITIYKNSPFCKFMDDIQKVKDRLRIKSDSDVEIFKKNLENIRPKKESSCEPQGDPSNIVKFFNVYVEYEGKSLTDKKIGMATQVALLGCPWEEISSLTDGENIPISGCSHEGTDAMLNKVLPKIKFGS